MDPFELRLRDEVLYLHSLWHQGPPRNPRNRRNPNPNPTPNPNPDPNPKSKPSPSKNLHPSNPTPFKKDTTSKKKKPKKKRGKNKNPESDPPQPSDNQWPCPEPQPESTGWSNLKPQSAQTTRPASAEEQAKFAAAQLQQKGLKACQEFFAGNAGSDSDGEEDDDSMDEDGSESDECEEFKFFMKVFMEDSELRGYYEKKYEGGEFCCLVCGGIGKKVGKRFKDCVALVQHSVAISKTKKKRAHRAYGQVVCKVLGWDINRLPTIVLSLGDPLGRSLAKSGESQGGSKGNADDGGNGEIVPNEDLPDKTLGSSNVVTGELMGCESSLKQGDASKHTEDLDNEIPDMVGASTEGVVNCPESMKEDGVGSVGNEIKDIQKEIVVLDGLKENGANENKEYLDKVAVEVITVNIKEAKDCTVSLKEDRVRIQMEDFQKDVVVSVGTNEGDLVEDICKVNSERTDYEELVDAQ